ncbi:MAG: hypothetical protein KGQ28_10440, partial [Hyphomicrobiales bacterium]|nr:hypothetical protein [Hyphomicrobiales bacterium]
MRVTLMAICVALCVSLGVPLASGVAFAADVQAKVVVTNGGQPVPDKARYELHAAGAHASPVVRWAGAGSAVTVPEGDYDIEVIFEDGAAHRNIWLDGQKVGPGYEKTVDINLPVATVTYNLTNGGKPDDGKARVELHVAGKHDGPVIAWAPTGRAMRVPAGRYDVQAIFDDGAAHRTFWVDGQDFSGAVERTLEVGMQVATVTYNLTNGGKPDDGKARVELHVAGKHDGPVVAWAPTGRAMRVPAGRYDVQAIFDDGAAHRTFWVDG